MVLCPITVTLDTYGHLLPKIDAALDEALDGMYRSSALGPAGPPVGSVRSIRSIRQ